MVHNAIEYGLMQAYAEGFELFHRCEFELDNAKIAHLWNQGSVIRSWLCELAARAFEADGNDLANLEGWVEDSGEGRWTLEEAIELARPLPGAVRGAQRALRLARRRRLPRARARGAAQPVRRPRRPQPRAAMSIEPVAEQELANPLAPASSDCRSRRRTS